MDQPRIAQLIKRRFGVSYHPSHVGQMMHELDYTPQLPAKRSKRRDQAKIDRWRSERWPAIVHRARQNDAVIVFVDEACYLLEPLRKRVWSHGDGRRSWCTRAAWTRARSA